MILHKSTRNAKLPPLAVVETRVTESSETRGLTGTDFFCLVNLAFIMNLLHISLYVKFLLPACLTSFTSPFESQRLLPVLGKTVIVNLRSIPATSSIM